MPLPQGRSIEIYLLHEIEARGGSVRARHGDVYEAVASHFPLLTEEDKRLTNVATGENKWRNRVDWARYALVRNGELDGSQRGIWKMARKGHERLRQEWPPTEPPEYSTRLYTDRPRSKKPGTRVTGLGPPQALQPQSLPAEVAAIDESPTRVSPVSLADLIAIHLDELKRALSDRMANLSAEQFEELVAELLRRLGYAEVRRVGGPGDRNIDVTGTYLPPFVRIPVRVQVKHRRSAPNIGPTDVAAFRDRAGGAGHTLLMATNVEFTDGAKETASEQGRQLVHLVDGKEFINAMVDKRIGVKEGSMGVLGIDEDFWGQF